MTDGKRALVIGASRSGKSYLAKKKILPGLDRVVIFDPENEYGSEPGVTAVNKAGLLRAFQDKWDKSFKIAYQPNRRELAGVQNPLIRELDQLSWLCLEMADDPATGGKMPSFTVLVDELHMSDPLHKPGGYENFDWLCRTGGKRGISVIGVTQAPADIGTSLRKNLDRVTVFRLSMPTDWKAVREITGHDVHAALADQEKYARFEYIPNERAEVVR